MLGTTGLFPLQLSSPSCLSTTFRPASHHILATTDNQFHFKPKHGTNMCIFYLNRLHLIMSAKIPRFFYIKQTASYYVTKDSPVDASKAFGRTNHNLLFAKLIKAQCTNVYSKTVVELV